MSNHRQIRTAIANLLKGATGIGQVHEYERYAKRMADFVKFYQGPDATINGWNIRRVSEARTSNAIGRINVTTNWRISGYVAINDELQSELKFDDIIDKICQAFATDETLGGAVASTVVDNLHGGQLDESEPVEMSEVLCHSCKIFLKTRYYLP